jgi:AraC-like DNA-binding protein
MDQKPFYQKDPTLSEAPYSYSENEVALYPYHWHSCLEILYGIRGKIWVSVDGQQYELAPRDIVIINSGSIHGLWGGLPDTFMGYLEVRPEVFDGTMPEWQEPAARNFLIGKKNFISPADDGDIHRRLEKCILGIRNEQNSKKKSYHLAIKAKLYEMALVFQRDLPEKNTAPGELADLNYNHEILERIFTFIHNEHSDPGLTLERAANAAGLSKCYFSRFFKKNTGQTFHAYLSNIRITHAREYLIESNLTIIDIALQCGFGSKETFNRLFKLLIGVPPSLYRRKKVSKNILKGNI